MSLGTTPSDLPMCRPVEPHLQREIAHLRRTRPGTAAFRARSPGPVQPRLCPAANRLKLLLTAPGARQHQQVANEVVGGILIGVERLIVTTCGTSPFRPYPTPSPPPLDSREGKNDRVRGAPILGAVTVTELEGGGRTVGPHLLISFDVAVGCTYGAGDNSAHKISHNLCKSGTSNIT